MPYLTIMSNYGVYKNTAVGSRETSQSESNITSPNSPIKNHPAEIQTDSLTPTCIYTGTNLEPLPEKEILYTTNHAVVSASSFTSIKFVKQFRKWLEARKDQHTARKLWSEYTVDCYLNKLHLNCDKKPLPFLDITPD